MLFNSIAFIIFLPIVFLLYWFVLKNNLKLQNLFIVLVSYTFYGWWDWRFLFLIVFTSFCSYISGLLIKRYLDKEQFKKAKIVSAVNIFINLLILGFFKYFNFFVLSFASAFDYFGITLSIITLKIILPVGISFYTFQALSYSIDVYKRRLSPTKDIVSFFAFVSFFPQLVAGPIERATSLLPQFYKKRTFDYINAVDGCRQMLWGFFKKIVVADNCAVLVNQIFDSYQNQSSSTLVFGAILFTFQIYGDFSGYSDIAIGCARLFGIELKRNFHFPYFSRDIAEFWRRWHISLNTWFRDYVYIPLGGSREGRYKTIRNTLIIFLISGLWHGANWTFVAWGSFHALLFLPLLINEKNRINTDIVAQNTKLPSIKEFLQIITTFSLVVIGWIMFRADSISQAFDYISRIFSSTLFTKPYFTEPVILLSIPILIVVEYMQRRKEHGLVMDGIKSEFLRYCIYIPLILLIWYYSEQKPNVFIYFQF